MRMKHVLGTPVLFNTLLLSISYIFLLCMYDSLWILMVCEFRVLSSCEIEMTELIILLLIR